MKTLDELIQAIENGEPYDERDVLHFLCTLRSERKIRESEAKVIEDARRQRDYHIQAIKALQKKEAECEERLKAVSFS